MSAATLPDTVAGVRWRTATPADAAVVEAFVDTVVAVDEPENPPSSRSIGALLAAADVRGDAVLGERDGEVVAFGVVQRPADVSPVRLSGGVLPGLRGRGIGRALLAAQIAHGRAVAPAGQSVTPERAAETCRLAARAGFVPERVFLHLVRAAPSPPSVVPLPAGLAVGTPRPEGDEALRMLKNAVFADHWRPHVETPESWAAKQHGPQLRRDLSRVALLLDGSAGAFVLTWVEQDHPGEANIALVGTARALRGRGVARALLTEVLHAIADAGLERVTIDVDGDSPIGADRLYRALGFERASAATVWALQP